MRIISKQAESIWNLIESTEPKKYFVLTAENPKLAYDLLVQYPTGKVDLFDDAKMKHIAFTPKTTESIVFIATNETINNLQQNNFDILEKVGLTYRSNNA